MNRGLFIVGTDTDVGKTYQAVRLAEALRSRNLRVGCYKPVASGAPVEAEGSDASLLAKACGVERNMLNRVCPQAFSTPLAAPVSASLEGKHVDEDLLINGAKWWQTHCEILLIEGAGGLMSPVSQRLTVIDLAQRLGFPLLLVVANRLGCVSHTLLAAEAINRRNLQLAAIVLNGWDTGPARFGIERTGPEQEQLERTNFSLIQQFLPTVPIVRNACELAGKYDEWESTFSPDLT
jgi:dethiobiotin synthetase